jgi:hypothetical protein
MADQDQPQGVATGKGYFAQHEENDSESSRGIYSFAELRMEALSELSDARRRGRMAADAEVEQRMRHQEEMHQQRMRFNEQHHLLWTALFSVTLQNLTGTQNADQNTMSALTSGIASILDKMPA